MPLPHSTSERAANTRKDPSAPKGYRPSSSFFVSEQRDKTCPGLRYKEQMRILGDTWAEMTKKEKAPYNIFSLKTIVSVTTWNLTSSRRSDRVW
mmetsp:Transcript_13408/g.32730  ORF Transcript_13408/g.32730 Transcript_13408/m.32730 type:complete len:94 (-) Transcript_13408:130-411(-)